MMASFLHNPNQKKLAFKYLTSHSDTQRDLNLYEEMGWYEGHYTIGGHLECRVPSTYPGAQVLPSTFSGTVFVLPEMNDWVKRQWPTFEDFLRYAVKEGARLESGSDADENLLVSVMESTEVNVDERTRLVKLIIEMGVKPNVIFDGGNTPLVWAAYYGLLELIELFIAAGCPVNGRNQGWKTPLIWAAEGGRSDAVLLLLKHGADKNLTTINDDTAYDLATGLRDDALAALKLEDV